MMFHLIYLAAGYSSRFGSNKLYYVIKGKPMYRHVLDRLYEITCEGNFEADLTVVTQYKEIGQDLAGKKIRVVYNPDPARGIASSVVVGTKAVAGALNWSEQDYFVYFNADQPNLRKETVEDFLTALEYGTPELAAMGVDGKAMNPCAFAGHFRDELFTLSGDRGGKQILKANEDKIFLFELDDPEELEDIDVL